jgi:hypothetical protein
MMNSGYGRDYEQVIRMSPKREKPTADQLSEALKTFADNPEWLGFGYIGERRYLTPAQSKVADEVVIAYAVRYGWSEPELFLWANSKLGRWFAEEASFGHAADRLSERAIRNGLFDLGKIRQGI